MKTGIKRVDWRKDKPRLSVPKIYKRGEKERETEILMKKIAPCQKEFRSKAAEEGEKMAPFWRPDDIGTKGFDEHSGTAYLRKM